MTNNEKQLIQAAFSGDVPSVRAMIKSTPVDAYGEAPDSVTGHAGTESVVFHFRRWKTTALMAASSQNHISLIELLLSNGANANLGDVSSLPELVHGRTALHFAASGAHREAIEVLLRANALTNISDSNGETSLVYSVHVEDVDSIKLLLKAGASASALGHPPRYYTPLGAAVSKGNEKIVALLLDSGAAINQGDKFGATPLQLAVYKRNIGVTQLLLSRGADPNIRGQFGKTPLIQACSGGAFDGALVSMLLSHGADPNVVDDNGKTALNWARRERFEAGVKLLHAAGGRTKRQLDEMRGDL